MGEQKKQRKHNKTETVKQRSIYVYLPSLETAQRWKETANKEGASISKFVIEHVENSIQQIDHKENYTSIADLQKQVTNLKEENQKLLKQNKMMDTVIDRLEDELRTYRVKPLAQEDFRGRRKYESDLTRLFKTKKEIRKDKDTII